MRPSPFSARPRYARNGSALTRSWSGAAQRALVMFVAFLLAAATLFMSGTPTVARPADAPGADAADEVNADTTDASDEPGDGATSEDGESEEGAPEPSDDGTESAEPADDGSEPAQDATEADEETAESVTEELTETTSEDVSTREDEAATEDELTGEEETATEDEASEDDEVEIQSVPVPEGNDAVVSVRVGGERTGTTDVAPLEGVVLGLFSSMSASEPVDEDWALCTSDADGDCNFTIPETQSGFLGGGWGSGENFDRALYVKAVSAPAGYTAMLPQAFGAGMDPTTGPTNTPLQASNYGFRVGSGPSSRNPSSGSWELRAGNTYRSFGNNNTFMFASGTNRWSSGGVFPLVRDNPVLSPQCGADIAVIHDYSTSMSGFEDDLAGATTAVIDALTGTPTTVSLYNFGSLSPALGMPENRPVKQSIANEAGAETVRGWYSTGDGQTANFSLGNPSNGTNWDRGLWTPGQQNNDYDVALFITDGNPTFFNEPAAGSGNFTRFREVENAILSANALKAQGTTVISVGAGISLASNAEPSRLNLQAVSGPVEGQDYFQDASFDALGAMLGDLLTQNCDSGISIAKEVFDEGDDPSTAELASGWTFEVTADDPVAVDPSNGTTGSSGAVFFDLDFTDSPNATVSVTVTEEDREGHALHDVQCSSQETGDPLEVDRGDDPLSFTLHGVGAGVLITCTVTNVALNPDAELQVDHLWRVDLDGSGDFEESALNEDPSLLPGVAASLKVDGESHDFGTVYGGYSVADLVGVEQSVSGMPPLCSLETEFVPINPDVEGLIEETGAQTANYELTLTAAEGVNTVRIINTVVCESRFTLLKSVANGPADAEAWLLRASDRPADLADAEMVFEGPSGSASSLVLGNQHYQLGAHDGDPRYVQDDVRTDLEANLLSTGSWICTEVDDDLEAVDGSTYADGENGGAYVPIGSHILCEAISRTAELTLLKLVDNVHGGILEPGDFTLSATPEDGVPGLTGADVTGAEQPEDDNTLYVRPGHHYTADEVSDLPYSAAGFQRWTGSTDDDTVVDHEDGDLWEDVSRVELAVGVQDHEIYRFVNNDVPGVDPDVAKSVAHLEQLVSGEWVIRYEIAVSHPPEGEENPHGLSANYDLHDELTFGPGVSVTGAGFTAGSEESTNLEDHTAFTGHSAVIAEDAQIAPGETHRYTVLAHATVDESDEANWICADGESQAFTNTTHITHPGEDELVADAAACAEPVAPAVDKTDGNAVEIAPGVWEVSYEISVFRQGDADEIAVAYELVETWPTLPTGVTMDEPWRVTGPEGFDPVDSAESPQVIASGLLAEGEIEHVYQVTGLVEVSAEAGNAPDERCDDVDGIALVNTVDVHAGPDGLWFGDATECATIEVGIAEVAKTVTSNVFDGEQWTVTYEIEASNAGDLGAVYSLSDRLRFATSDEGVEITSASWSGPDGLAGAWEDDAFGDELTFVTDRALAAGSTETYQVTVTAEVSAEALLDEPVRCSSETSDEGEAFLNEATITTGGQDFSDTDCAEPGLPTIEKTAVSSVADGEAWTVSYQLAVTASEDHDTVYDLYDVPAFPQGVEILEARAHDLEGNALAWSGDPAEAIVSDVALAAGQTHSYLVEVDLVVTGANISPGDLECGVNGEGLFNTATLVVGPVDLEDDACSDIEVGIAEVAKTVTSNVFDGEQWTVTYEIEASNDGELAAAYSLSDRLRFATSDEGVEITSASWSGPDGLGGSWDEDAFGDELTFVTDRALAGGATETFEVTATAEVSAEALLEEPVRCSSETPNQGGEAFLNEATITTGGETFTDTDCAEPGLPEISKDVASVLEYDGDTHTWVVSYPITVTASEDHDTVYDLYDVPAFPQGVEITAARAYDADEELLAWSGDSAEAIVSDVELSAGQTHSYLVQVDLTVPGAIVPPEALECGDGPNEGLYNTAILVVGPVDLDDDACAPLDEMVVPAVDKTVTSYEPGEPGQWLVSYQIEVTQPDAGSEINPNGLSARYDLTDTLDYGTGIDVLEATWVREGTSDGGSFNGDHAELAAGTLITAGDTHVYTVSVRAEVTDEAHGDEPSFECSADGEAGGFLNTALVTSHGHEIEVADCAEPTSAQVAKTAQETLPVSGPEGTTWEVGYLVEVVHAEGEGADAPYVLVDAPGALPGGLELVGTWNAEAGEDTPAPDMPVAPQDGEWVLTTGTIAAGETHSYLITAEVTATNPELLDPGYCRDDEGVVLTNLANVSWGSVGNSDETCTTIDVGIADLTKTVTSNVFDGEQWTVSYDVVVNNAGEVDAFYSLSDRLRFAAPDEGVEITSASWSGPDGLAGSWDEDAFGDELNFVTNRALAGGTAETYEVVVTAVVSAEALLEEPVVCSTKAPKRGGEAFLNEATITTGGQDFSATDCAEPGLPTIEKTTVSSEPTGDGWTVSYELTATASEDHDTVYDLYDVPAFPQGVEILAARAYEVDAEMLAWSGDPAEAIVSDVALPAGQVHTYVVEVDLVVTGAGISPGDLECGVDGEGLFNTATLVVGPVDLEDDACSSIELGVADVVKTVSSNIFDGEQWTVTYEIEASNTGDLAAAYSLSDQLRFAAPEEGVEITSASWSGPDGLAGSWEDDAFDAELTFVTDRALAAGSTETFEVVVTAVVTDEAFVDEPVVCSIETPSQGGEAFLNEATITTGGQDFSDTDCAEPGLPEIEKTAVSSEPTGDGWTLVYQLTVTAGEDHDTVYDLYDVPAYPSGVRIREASATDLELNPLSWSGDPTEPIVSGMALAAGQTHTYLVSVDVEVTGANISPEDLLCGEGTEGLFNTATLVVGPVELEDDACSSIDTGIADVTKSVTSNAFDGEQWTVIYEIEASNAGDLAAAYSLSDRLRFAAPEEGVEITSASWSGPDGLTGSWEDDAFGDELTFVTDRALTAGSTETYQVTVTAEVSAEALLEEPVRCSIETPNQGGEAFLNEATITTGGQDFSDTDCAEPGLPTIEKTAVTSVADGDVWTVSYELAVTASQDHDTVYDLYDVPAYPQGVEILGASATDVELNPIVWSGNPEEAIVSGVALATGQVHTYLVAVDLVVTGASSTPEDVECGEAGEGLFNTATLVVGPVELDDDACATIEVGTADVTKAVTSNAFDGEQWTVIYDVVVSNAGEFGAAYSLADRLRFAVPEDGVVITSAEWSGPGDLAGAWEDDAFEDELTFVTDRALAAGATETFEVTVTAVVSAEALLDEPVVCSIETPAEGDEAFLNEATIVTGGKARHDTACAGPGLPEISKDVASVSYFGETHTWVVAYPITVTAGDDHDTVYDLYDVPAYPQGVEIIEVRAYSGEDQLPWSGDPTVAIVSDVELPAEQEHTYVVQVELTVPGTVVPPEALECGKGPGEGLYNTAILAVGPVELDDDACAPLEEMVVPSVIKTVTSQEPGEPGQWVVDYQIEVAQPEAGSENNPNGLSARYDLTDTLEYGEGITVLEAMWVREGTDQQGAFDGEYASLAEGALITAGDTHVYTVSVRAEVTVEAYGEVPTTQCLKGGEAGGFLNTALLTSHGMELPVADCAEPTTARITKTAQESVPVDGSEGTVWELSYLVEVTHHEGEDAAAPYVLIDAPQDLPEGLELVGTWHAEALAGTPAPEAPLAPEDGEWVIVTSVVGAEETHLYRITAGVVVTNADMLEPGTCGTQEGVVVTNTASISWGTVGASDSDCTLVHLDEEPPAERPGPPPAGQPKPPGGLPVTGAAVGWTALGALLLLLLGAGGVAAQRRRTGA